MAFLPPEGEYQDRVNDAWLKHVAGGLRSELKDDSIPPEASDEDVVRYYRDNYASGSHGDEFNTFLTDTYGHNFKPPSQTFGEKAGGVVRGVIKGAPSMGQQIAGQTGAETVAHLAGQTARTVGAPVLGGAYLARLVAQIHGGHELGQIADKMPVPDINTLQKHYYESLSPGLTAKGYTPDQVANEVQRRVGNVVRGYTATQNSLMGDIETTSQDMISSAAEGISNIALLGQGGGFFKNALLSGARRAAGEKVAQKVTSSLAGRLVTHAATGAALGSQYGAITGGIESGAAAAQTGRPVAGAVASGAISGGMGGAVGGAAVGGPLGVALDALGGKAIVAAGAQTPKPPAPPTAEMGTGDLPIKQPMKLTGVEPTTQAPAMGSQEWWNQYHGVTTPTSPLREPLAVERFTQKTPEEVSPRLPAPEAGPALEGPPRGRVEPIVLPGEKRPQGNDEARAVIKSYTQQVGIPETTREMYPKLDSDKGQQLAQAYEQLQSAKPGTPEYQAAAKSYGSLNQEIAAQYKAITDAGYKIEFTGDDPYKNSAEMRQDVQDNKRLKVFAAPAEHHPFMTPEQTNVFRAVHDFFGHAAEGYEFGPRGEDAAFRQHAATLSNNAIPALATETRGQNSWVNFHPKNAALPAGERPFAEQKFGLMPPWTYNEVLHPTGEVAGFQERALPHEAVARMVGIIKEAGGNIEGARVSVRPNGDGNRLVLDSLKGAAHGAGASGKALDRITASADKTGVPIDVTVTDYSGPRGGTVPAEKQAQWYEKKGFVRTNTTEGAISLHRPVAEPNAPPPLSSEQIAALAEHHIGEAESTEEAAQLEAFMKRVEGLPESRAQEALGNIEEGKPMIQGGGTSGQPSVGMRLGAWLDNAAAEADKRIQTKLGRLYSGFDPTLIGDYAIKAAAKMYRLGLTAVQSLKREMLKDHPDIPNPAMKEIIQKARDLIGDRLNGDKMTVTTLSRLLDAADEGKPGADWYDKTAGAVNKMFGQDGDMMLRFLAATSAGKAADANVSLALKAYSQWKLGLPFDGFMGNDQAMLEKASRGEVFGERKLQSILAALRGDENSVAIDRHVMRALGFEKAGAQKGNLTDREYDFFEAVIRDLAQSRGVTPRQFQAALWTSAKIRQAQSATNPREMSYLHSFRPYEGIMQYEHGLGEDTGKTPLDWVQDHRITLQHLSNASEGVKTTRDGGGYTYSPYDYSAYKGNHGVVVTLASVKVPTDKLSGSELIGFTQRFKKLLASYYGMNTGTWNLDRAGEAGQSSMDLNVVLPESMRDRAVELGKERKQRALWDIGKGEEIPTGYSGVTADAPADPKERARWWKQQHDEIDRIMQKVGVPSRALRQQDLFNEPVSRVTSNDEYWGLEAENTIPPDVHKALEEAKTPEDITNVIAANEGPLAASLKKAGLAQNAETLKGDGSATDLLRYYLRKKGLDHEVVLGKDDNGSGRVWVRTKDGTELDPAAEGMHDGEVVKDTAEPELKRGQIEAMLRTPHRWRIYAAQQLGKTEPEVDKLVDAGKLTPISDAGMLDHVEVHKDGDVWEYVDPTKENGYNIMEKVGSFAKGKVTDMLNYLEGKHILTGHDVVQDYRSQAGYVRVSDGPKLLSFARSAPIQKITSAMVDAGGEQVQPATFRHTHPAGVSLWISPDGKTIQVPFHLRNADMVIKKLRLKNPVEYEGPEHDALQTILNHGFVRVQLHDQAFASDATVPLTAQQVTVLKELGRGAGGQRSFAGRLTNSNGEHREMFDDYHSGSGSLNKYIAESRGK